MKRLEQMERRRTHPDLDLKEGEPSDEEDNGYKYGNGKPKKVLKEQDYFHEESESE